MNSHQVVEDYLQSVARRLDLPADTGARVLSELRTHLIADIADRIAAGQDAQAAVLAAVAEMGDANEVALGLNRENQPQGTMLRAMLAMQLTLFGLIGVGLGVGGGFDRLVLRPFATATGALKFAPESDSHGPGVIAYGWYASWSAVAEWRFFHPVALLLLAIAAMAPVMFVVGYVARRRGWLFGFIPWAFLVLIEMKCAFRPSFGTWAADVPGGLFLALVLIGGGHLGVRFYQSRFRYRAVVIAVTAGLLAPVGVAGLISSMRNAVELGIIVIYAAVLAFLTWASLVTARLCRSRLIRRGA